MSSQVKSPIFNWFPNPIDFSHREPILKDDTLGLIADYLQRIQEQFTLVLSNNSIEFRSVPKLLETLRNSQIKAIKLDSNKIGTHGVYLLSSFLQTTSTLTAIDLSDNKAIGTKEFIQLAKAFAKNQSIKMIKLTKTSIDDKAIPAIKKMLKKNRAIVELHLTDYQFTIHGQNTLQKFMFKRKDSYSHSINIIIERILIKNHLYQVSYFQKSSLSDSGQQFSTPSTVYTTKDTIVRSNKTTKLRLEISTISAVTRYCDSTLSSEF